MKRIERIQGEFKSSDADVRWVNPDKIHLTLKFFGDIEESQIDSIMSSIEKPVQSTQPFQLKVHGTGDFPNPKNPRVVWVGLAEGKEALSHLQRQLESSLDKVGFQPEDRSFHPHLTLGRVTYAMTGWRVGYLCAPKDLCEAALKIHQYVMLCAPVMGQIGALEAVKSAEGDKNTMVNEYRLRRNMFVSGLNRIGLPTHIPQGAFYAFPSVKGTGLSDTEFAERLLKEQRVAVVPGSVFGAGGDYHLRCAYAVSRKKLSEALSRIETFINGL